MYLEFHKYIIICRKEKGYLLSQSGNADQTPVFLKMPFEKTISIYTYMCACLKIIKINCAKQYSHRQVEN